MSNIKEILEIERNRMKNGPYTAIHLFQEDPTVDCRIIGKPSDWDELPHEKSLFHSAQDCGLPIGNLTSQLFSNVYLNSLDQYMKRELHCRHYGRYVDDFYVVSSDKEWLESLVPKVSAFLSAHLGLTIHEGKTMLCPANKGVEVTARVLLSKDEDLSDVNDRSWLRLNNGMLQTTLTDLELNKKYYFCFEVCTLDERKRSEEINHFETEGDVLRVVTAEPANITWTSVTAGGSVSAVGDNTVDSRGICWGTDPMPNTTQQLHIPSGAGEGAFEVEIMGLLPETKYYMRAYALCGDLVCYGNEVSFITAPNPVVENPEPYIEVADNYGYLYDGAVADIDVEYFFGFNVASNVETQEKLCSLVITVDDQEYETVNQAIDLFQNALETMHPTTVYNNVSTTANGTYNDVIGTIMPNGETHLINVTKCEIGEFTAQGYPATISGNAK